MRKLKVFTASVLAYLMLISLVPSNLVERIVNAAENDYIITVKNDNYFKAGVQYGDELIVAYSNNSKLVISSIKNGVETVLKEVDGYLATKLYQDGDIIKIKYYGEGKFNSDICYYEKLNLKNKTFEEINENEWNNDSSEEDYIRDYKITSDKDIEYNLEKISKDSDLKVSIKGASRLSQGYYTEYENETQLIDININQVSKNIGLVYGKIVVTEKQNNNLNAYNVVVYNDKVYISKVEDPIYEYIKASYDTKSKLVIIIEGNYEDLKSGCKITEIDLEGNEVTRELEVNDISDLGRNFFKINNKLYLYEKNIKVYGLKDNKYVLENEINSGIHSESINEYDDNYLFLDKETKTLNKIDNKGNISKFIDLGESVDLLRGEVYITNYKNNSLLIKGYNHFIIVQNKSNQTEDKPTEDTPLDIEVPTLNANEVNEIPVLSSNTKNFNVIVKDIESLKNGQGSLKLALNNVTLNLPFSVVDKDLLDGNDTVSVKLDVLADSEITKDLKAVNKVFDFNLVVNKENEAVKIHNFKEGVAEITFALTDEDLNGLSKDKLKVYYYNEETKAFEAMETKVEGNNVTFKTSHFSKYIISEEIVDNTVNQPNTDNKEPDKNEEVTIKPDADNTNNSTTNGDTTKNEESSIETGKGNLPNTGVVISTTTVLVLAVGIIAIGGAMFIKKRKNTVK